MTDPREEDIRVWYPRLYRVALRMTGRHHDAVDYVQDAFARAIEKWHQFDQRSSRATWLHRILVNRICDAIRRQRKATMEPFDLWAVHHVVSDGRSPEDHAVDTEQAQRLHQAIARLPEELRQALVATVLDGYSYREAAELLNVPQGTVGSRVFKARERLQAELPEMFEVTRHG